MRPRQRGIRNIGVTVLSDPGWDMRGRMRSFSLGRHNPRASRVAFGLTAVGAAMLLAACSSSSNSSSSSTTPQSSAPSSSSSAAPSSSSSSSVDLSALSADITKASATPSFSDYGPQYGGKIPSIANLAGKKIMIIPGVSALAACEEIAQAASDFAKAAGMVPTIFDNQGSPAEHNTAIENAIHQGYAAVIMGCAMDPSQDTPAIAAAQKAGLVVGVYGGTPDMDQRAGTTYNTDDPYALDATLATEQAIEQHNGQPFNAIAITSFATGPATVIEQDAIKAELAKDCPACTLSGVNVEVPQWQTQIASTVTAQLLQHPETTVLFPDY